jgi:hypothetical protein
MQVPLSHRLMRMQCMQREKVWRKVLSKGLSKYPSQASYGSRENALRHALLAARAAEAASGRARRPRSIHGLHAIHT